MVYDGYVKYEEAEIHRSANMQDFRNSEGKKKLNCPTGGHFGFFSVKFVMGYSCVRSCEDLMATFGFFSVKFVMGYSCVRSCEDLMATFSRNALTSISSLVAIVIKGLMIWGSKCHQNNSPVVCDGYVKYEEAEVDRLVAILKANNCRGGPCVIQ